MLYSYDWLKRFCPDIPAAEELEEKLTLHTVEVEGIISGGDNLDDVVVAEVLETGKHPNADKLNIGKFDVDEDEPRQIVYGGKALLNVGDKIPLALAPTTLPGGVKIKKSKLRGEVSNGMCCLNSELGILNNAEEVHLFDANVKNGSKITDVLSLDSVLIDIDNKSMTHRPDLFSHRGMAREIAAVCGVEFKDMDIPTADLSGKSSVSVKVQDEDLCPRYVAVEMEVTVGETPAEIAQRLAECDSKSINNVVDITNYVMYELGQPMHSFDADKIQGNKIVVRKAKKGETLLTLDNEDKELSDTLLVIADKKIPVAAAGVIGGLDSGVSENTTRIILEIANFNDVNVRKATQQLGVRTDSSLRYEKGLPVYSIDDAMHRAVQLLQEHADGKIIGMVDTNPTPEDTKLEPVQITGAEIARATGMEFSQGQITEYLESLECIVEHNNDMYTITPPLHRTDLHIPEDIIEEIAKLYGVNNLPDQKLEGVLSVPQDQPEVTLREELRPILNTLGCTEIYNYSMYGADLIEKVGYSVDKDHVEVANPLSEDVRYMRISLLPRMLENISRNQNYAKSLQLFEIGHVFFTDTEAAQLALAVTGENALQRLKGIVEELFNMLGVTATADRIAQGETACLYWGQYANDEAIRYDSGENILGTVGTVDQTVLDNMGIETPVAFAVLSFSSFIAAKRTLHVNGASPFPAVQIDLSFIMPQELAWSEIDAGLKKHFGNILKDVTIFDQYTGDKIPAGTKSIAFSLTLQSQKKTLEMPQIEKMRDTLCKELAQSHKVELRDK